MRIYVVEKKSEDTKSVIRSRNSKMERKYNGQNEKWKTIIYKTLHRKLSTEQHETH